MDTIEATTFVLVLYCQFYSLPSPLAVTIVLNLCLSFLCFVFLSNALKKLFFGVLADLCFIGHCDTRTVSRAQ